MLYIHPDECVDCGACEPVCPVEAIFYEDDTPEQWKEYYKANVEFFDDIGSPGGASKIGKINKDHPFIAALPPLGEARADPRRSLPDFPWDLLAPYGEEARAPPGGIVDLSIGAPRSTRRPRRPGRARRRRRRARLPAHHGHAGPARGGRGLARAALRRDVAPDAVLPLIGTKEFISSLPLLLRRRATRWLSRTGLPHVRHRCAAGRRDITAEQRPLAVGPERPGLPGSTRRATRPGRCCPPTTCAKVVDWARDAGHRPRQRRVLHLLRHRASRCRCSLPEVCDGRHEGLLAVHSLSKRSNLAGYRAGFVVGDPGADRAAARVRKHAGMIVPAPSRRR